MILTLLVRLPRESIEPQLPLDDLVFEGQILTR